MKNIIADMFEDLDNEEYKDEAPRSEGDHDENDSEAYDKECTDIAEKIKKIAASNETEPAEVLERITEMVAPESPKGPTEPMENASSPKKALIVATLKKKHKIA